MSIQSQARKKNGQFSKGKKLTKKLAKPKPKLTKVQITNKKSKPQFTASSESGPKFAMIPLSQRKEDLISPKLKNYINERMRHQNDYILECLHIFLMDLEGALERDQLDWED